MARELKPLTGERIRTFREAQGWTQQEFAEILGFKSRQSIFLLETNRIKLTRQGEALLRILMHKARTAT